MPQSWLRKQIAPQIETVTASATGSWLRRPAGYNVMEPPAPTYRPPLVVDPTTGKTDRDEYIRRAAQMDLLTYDEFTGMPHKPDVSAFKYPEVGKIAQQQYRDRLAGTYRIHQAQLLNPGKPVTEVPAEPDAPMPFSLGWFRDVGVDLDQAGVDLLDAFYKKTGELTDRAYGLNERREPTSTDSFTDPEFEPVRGLSQSDAPYAYAGMRSAMGVLSGPFHLLGGVGTIYDAGREDGVKGAAKATGESLLGMLTLFNPLDPDIDGPERFHRSLNLMLAGAGGLKGFKGLRERGAVKVLVKEHGLEKAQAKAVVAEVKKGLAEIDKELGQTHSFQNAIDDLTQSRLRSLVRTIDPGSVLARTVEPFVPTTLPTPDMNRGQNLIGDEVPMPYKENRAFMDFEPKLSPEAMRRRAEQIQQQAEHAFIDFLNTGDAGRWEVAAQLNGRADFLRGQAALKEKRFVKIKDRLPDPVSRTAAPAVPGDRPGPGRYSDPPDVPPGLGEPSINDRITVSPILDGPVVRDNQIWRDFFRRLRAKGPRVSDEVKKGRFDPKQSAMVVRSLRNASTVAHEAGHLFDQFYDLTENVPESELNALVGKLDIEPDSLSVEAAAEFVRGMLINPDEAALRAPTMKANWDARVPKDFIEAVGEAGSRIRRVMGQSPRDLTLSQVRLYNDGFWKRVRDARREKGAREAFKEGGRAVGDWWFDSKLDTTRPYKTPLHAILNANVWADDLAAIQSAQEYVKEVAHLSDLMPEEDAALLAARHRYINNEVSEMVAGGIRDQYGQVMYYSQVGGILQQVGRKTLTIDGKAMELPVLSQVDLDVDTGGVAPIDLGPVVLGPDGRMFGLDGTPRGELHGAEPLTLKWVLQPLRTAKADASVFKVFEDFITKGISERAMELFQRHRTERLPGLVKELNEAAPAETGRRIKNAVKQANDRYAQLYPDEDFTRLTVAGYERVLNGLDAGTELSKLADEGMLLELSAEKWRSKTAKKLVSEFREDAVTLTGAGRGLIDDASIAKVVMQPDGSPEYAAIREGLERYRAYSRALLRRMVHDGLLDEEGFKGIVQNNQAYFDLGRVMDEVSDRMDVPRYHYEEVKALTGRAKGSMREIEAPVVNLMANTEQAVRLGERNRVLNTFLDPIRNAQDPVAKNLLASVAEQVDRAGDNTLRVINKGKEEYWRFESEVYKALKPTSLLASIPSPVMAVLSFPRNLLLHGVTIMPDFIVRNKIRDFFDAVIKSRSRGADAVMRPFSNFKAAKEDLAAMRATPEEAGFYDEYGGGIAIFGDVSVRKGWYKLQRDVLRQVQADEPATVHGIAFTPKSKRVRFERAESFAEATSDLMGNKAGKVVKPVAKSVEWYFDLRARAERASRLAEYRRALDIARKEIAAQRPDWTPERVEHNAHLRAGQAARDIIDFARGSKVSKAINQVIPFFNATIQGFDRTIAKNVRDYKAAGGGLKGAGVMMKENALKALVAMATLSFTEWQLNRMAGTEDQWRDQPAYRKDFFWLIPTGRESNAFIYVPKPFEYGVLASIFPRVAYNDWGGFVSDDGSVMHGTVVQMLSPVKYDDLLFGPTETIVELATNQDHFRRSTIIPPYEQDLALELRKGKENASNLGKFLSMGQVDPRYVDHAIRGFTGNAGQTAMTVSGPMNAESVPRWINAISGLTTTDGSSNSTEVRKTMRYAASVGVTNVFKAEFDTLAEARGGDVFTGGHEVWKAKKAIVEKAKRINDLIEEKTAGKEGKVQLETIKQILREFN